MDNPSRTAPIISIMVPVLIRFGVCSELAVVSDNGLDNGSVFWATIATAIKLPTAKIITPSRNRRLLGITVFDLPKKAPMFPLR